MKVSNIKTCEYHWISNPTCRLGRHQSFNQCHMLANLQWWMTIGSQDFYTTTVYVKRKSQSFPPPPTHTQRIFTSSHTRTSFFAPRTWLRIFGDKNECHSSDIFCWWCILATKDNSANMQDILFRCSDDDLHKRCFSWKWLLVSFSNAPKIGLNIYKFLKLSKRMWKILELNRDLIYVILKQMPQMIRSLLYEFVIACICYHT